MPQRDAPATARSVARRVLARVRQDAAYANLALTAELCRAPALAAVERGLATELIYGVLRHQRRLDHALGRHARQPLEQLDDETRDALRLAAYQVLLLDRVPAYAAVDDAVQVVREARGPRLGGFANAVLRRLTPDDLVADLPADPLARLAVECSLPDTLARRWAAQLGLIEARALGLRLLERAPLVGRVNTLRIDRAALSTRLIAAGAVVTPGPRAPEALRIAALDEPFGGAYREGLWTAQDEAAQLVAHAVAPARGARLLDGCAGLGGKATHLAALTGDGAEVLCVDPSARKLQLLEEHCARLGVHGCRVLRGDLRDPGLLAGEAVDSALVDAPCSGLGVLARHPELKWRFDGSGIPALVVLQRELLAAATARLRPGGALVYAVCTTTEEEGPEQARWVGEALPELAPDALPVAALDDARVAGEHALRLWPHRHDTDGFFLARWRRR